MSAIHNHKQRILWDKGIEACYLVKVIDPKLSIWYQRNVTPIRIINKRDILEKRASFTEEGKTYVYFSSVPPDIFPPDEHVSRVTTVIGIETIEELEDGRIKIETLV